MVYNKGDEMLTNLESLQVTKHVHIISWSALESVTSTGIRETKVETNERFQVVWLVIKMRREMLS